MEPAEIGCTVAFLLFDAARAISGIDLPVDRGSLGASPIGTNGRPCSCFFAYCV
jgi:hypothetical protein